MITKNMLILVARGGTPWVPTNGPLSLQVGSDSRYSRVPVGCCVIVESRSYDVEILGVCVCVCVCVGG